MTPNTGYWVFIDEVLTIIDQETYNTGVFIDYLLVKISIFLVKTVAKSLYLSEVNHIDHETGYLMLWVVPNDLNL